MDSLRETLGDAFGESLLLADAMEKSVKYKNMPEKDRNHLEKRVIFSMLGFQDSLVIFQVHSNTDFDCHLEPRNPGCPLDLYPACEQVVEKMLYYLKKRRLKPSSRNIIVKFYQDSDEETGIIGEYQSFRNVLGETIKNEGLLWGGFTAIITVIVWFIKSGANVDTLRNSLITLTSIPFFVLSLAVIKTYSRIKKVFYHVKKY